MFTFVLIWLVIGLIAGFFASHLVGGGRGLVYDIVIGLVGAVIGGLILGTLFGYQASSFIGHVVVAFIGAAVLLMLLRLVDKPRGLFR